jgi:hypothetical protein
MLNLYSIFNRCGSGGSLQENLRDVHLGMCQTRKTLDENKLVI